MFALGFVLFLIITIMIVVIVVKPVELRLGDGRRRERGRGRRCGCGRGFGAGVFGIISSRTETGGVARVVLAHVLYCATITRGRERTRGGVRLESGAPVQVSAFQSVVSCTQDAVWTQSRQGTSFLTG